MKWIGALNAMFFLCCLSMGAHAEGNCPSGYYPIGGAATAGCAPIPGGNAGGNQQRAPDILEQIWQDRWGAVAFDGPMGILGVAASFPSERAAQAAALYDCKVKGGLKCQLETSYVNGCTAFTIGDGNYYRGSHALLDQAIAEGLNLCNQKDKNCETYYSACSLPVRIR